MTGDTKAGAGDPDAGRLGGILLASDLTCHSDRAFDRAVMLAAQHRSPLHVLHVVDEGVLPKGRTQRNMEDALVRLRHEVEESRIDPAVDTSVKVISGNVEKTILEEAVAGRSSLIVMGLARDATLATVFRGTTADRVVRRAECPVLVVKTRPRKTYERIVVALDLAEPSRRALDHALRMLPDARFTIVHAAEDLPARAAADGRQSPEYVERRNQIMDRVSARFADAGRPVPGSTGGPDVIVEPGKAVDVLQQHISRLRPDLVALGTSGRSKVSGVLLGSVAETLLAILDRDVLVARA
jgi:nucleotide-binding universal stress UspA family protein